MDEQQDVSPGVDADVVQAAVDPQGDAAGLVVAEAVVGVGAGVGAGGALGRVA
jgi:hypothetical protein